MKIEKEIKLDGTAEDQLPCFVFLLFVQDIVIHWNEPHGVEVHQHVCVCLVQEELITKAVISNVCRHLNENGPVRIHSNSLGLMAATGRESVADSGGHNHPAILMHLPSLHLEQHPLGAFFHPKIGGRGCECRNPRRVLRAIGYAISTDRRWRLLVLS